MALSLARRMEIRAAIDSGTEDELQARMNQESISAHLDKLDALIRAVATDRSYAGREGTFGQEYVQSVQLKLMQLRYELRTSTYR